MRQEFQSFSGRSYGFGAFYLDIPKPDPPQGWVAHDPYTGCCYCPTCWEEIVCDSDGEGKLEEAPDG